ncbi:MAG: sigma-70 family RNA polymerase sigma factor [Gemmatimonadaceae bacterium]|nr:sigma-70 family RNA polymerase sigma factor [Gemmatimonadaceae bacterium]
MTAADIELLFRTHHAALVRYLTRRLGDRDWAEEIAQETFLRALRTPPTTSARSWLFAVATNLVRDDARKQDVRRRQLQQLAAEEREREASQPTAEDRLARAHEAALARRALDALAERDREALLLKEEGLDYGEIADALGLSVSSVGTTLARARKRLAEAYDDARRAFEERRNAAS